MSTVTGALHHLETAVGTERFRLLLDPAHTGRVSKFLKDLEDEEIAKLLPTSMGDDEAIRCLVEGGRYDEANARKLVVTWRHIATVHDYKGPVFWRVSAGFTLKVHAPKAGPCWSSFTYLQEWNFEDVPTQNGYAFWIPRLLRHSTCKTAADQMRILVAARGLWDLPAHHLAGFGTVATQAALILAHFKRTGERTPLELRWIRTDTLHDSRVRLLLGGFVTDGLSCGGRWDDDEARGFLGVLPLGVETLGD